MNTKYWQLYVYLILASCLTFGLMGCSDGDGSGGGSGGTVGSAETASLEVSPSSVLLVEPDTSVQLLAIAYDADGSEVTAEVTWESSNPSVLSVNENGMVTRGDVPGSATITAQSGDISSNAVFSLAATPAAGAVLVNDNQVTGDFALVDPDAPWGLGVQYTVTLTGIDVPAAGTILVGTGEQPIGGRVVSATTVGSSVQVTLELIGLNELFDQLVINEMIDLSHGGFNVAQVISNYYDVSEDANGNILFTLKSVQPDRLTISPLSVDGTSMLNPDANLGPFTCTFSGTPPFVLDALPNMFSISRDLSAIVEYDSRDPEQLKRFGVDGKVAAEFKLGATLTAALETKVECKVTVVEIPFMGGPVSLVLGGYIPVGLGFELGGKIQLAQVGVELNAKTEAQTQFGMQLESGDWKTFATADNKSAADFKLISPTMPTDWVTAYSNLRLEPTLMGFGFADLEVGLKWRLSNAIAKYVGIPSHLRIKAFTTKAGIKQSGNFAIVEGQIADSDYKSKYSLDLEVTAGVGQTIDALLKMFQITLLKDIFKRTETIATSPTAAKVLADVGTYAMDDIVKFTVTLEEFNTTYPIIGYNVEEVLIYEKPEPDSGSNEAILIASIPAASGQTSFSYLWTADKSGSVAGNFFAFVKTKAIPIGYFDEFIELELGPVDPPGGAWLILGQEGPFNNIDLQYASVSISGSEWEAEEVPDTPCDEGTDCQSAEVIGEFVNACEGTGGIAESPYTATVDLSGNNPDSLGMSGHWQTKLTNFDGGQTATIEFSGRSTTPNSDDYYASNVEVDSGMHIEDDLNIYVINDTSVDKTFVISWLVNGETNFLATNNSYFQGGHGGFSLFYQLLNNFEGSCSAYGTRTLVFGASIYYGTPKVSSTGEYPISIPPGRWRVVLSLFGIVNSTSGVYPDIVTVPTTTTTIGGWVKFIAP